MTLFLLFVYVFEDFFSYEIVRCFFYYYMCNFLLFFSFKALFVGLVSYFSYFFLFFSIVFLCLLFFFFQNFGLFYLYKYSSFCIFFLIISVFCVFFAIDGFSFFYTYSASINFIFFKSTFLSFAFTKSSICVLFLVLVIFWFSMQFSFFYLYLERGRVHFFLFLFLFVLAMVFIFTSSNLILIYAGWELMGASSFFLIGYYSRKLSAMKSALKAFFFNKISDFFFVLAIILYYHVNGTFDMQSCRTATVPHVYDFYLFSVDLQLVMLLCIVVFSFIKSAQFFFSTWLLDSMDAPVPASALIHSATLVISGIVIQSRFLHVFFLYNTLVSCILVLSSITAVLASSFAVFSQDLKRVLAYSTISNCSFITCFLFFGDFGTFLPFLIIHGFLKAAVFLFLGVFFYCSSHLQCANKVFFFKYESSLYCAFSVFLFFLGFMPLTAINDLKHVLSINYFDLSSAFFCFFKCNIMFAFSSSSLYCLRLVFLVNRKNALFRKSVITREFTDLSNSSSMPYVYYLVRVVLLFLFFLVFFLFMYCFYYIDFSYVYRLSKNYNFFLFIEVLFSFFFLSSYVYASSNSSFAAALFFNFVFYFSLALFFFV